MPKVKQTYRFEIHPAQFLAACSDDELHQVWMLIGSPAYYKRIQKIIARRKNGHSLNQNNHGN